jgi:hypothetical protein
MLEEIKSKFTIEGKLFTIKEEDEGLINTTIELAGIDIWDLLQQHNQERVKLTLEILE